MKRLLLLLSLLLIPSLSKAQFYNSYYPHLTAALTAEAIDAKQLDNIRFDPHALALNPEAWATYQTYLDQVEQYNKKKKIYTTLEYTGLGIIAASLIPLFMNPGNDMIDFSYNFGNPRRNSSFAWGIGLFGTGAIIETIGLIGSNAQSNRIRNNKKDFIFYLKTSNNGIGIVTLF